MRTDHIAASVRMADKIRLFRVMLNNPEYGTITSDLSSAIWKMEKELIDSIHTSAVTAPSDNYPYWSTAVYVKEGDKQKRKYIRSKSHTGLYEKLYDHYFGVGTLNQIHALWADHRRQFENLAPETNLRETQRWNKYLQDTDLGQMRINDIDNFMIEDHVYSLIKKFSLKEKELNEIKFLLRKTFHFAVRSKVITKNPMDYVEINKTGCAPATPRLSASRIYMPDEVARMDAEITQELIDIPWNTTALAIRLLFLLGLRIGEVVALRLSDIDQEEETIHIQREEQKGEAGKPTVVEHTKKKSIYGNRILPLGKKGMDLIREVLEINEKNSFKDEDYLFLGETGKRITSRAVDNRIRKLCRRAGIEPAKSAHDIRRTVATRLYRNTHDVELVRQFLGHSDVQTTWGYIVNIDAEKEDRRRIVEALQGDPGTHIVDFTVYRMKGSSKGRKGGKKGRLVTG